MGVWLVVVGLGEEVGGGVEGEMDGGVVKGVGREVVREARVKIAARRMGGVWGKR